LVVTDLRYDVNITTAQEVGDPFAAGSLRLSLAPNVKYNAGNPDPILKVLDLISFRAHVGGI